MVTNKIILIFILCVVYSDPYIQVLCDNWISNWTDHFTNNQINEDIWHFDRESINKSYGKTDRVLQLLLNFYFKNIKVLVYILNGSLSKNIIPYYLIRWKMFH